VLVIYKAETRKAENPKRYERDSKENKTKNRELKAPALQVNKAAPGAKSQQELKTRKH
jgi:hypothetical protein